MKDGWRKGWVLALACVVCMTLTGVHAQAQGNAPSTGSRPLEDAEVAMVEAAIDLIQQMGGHETIAVNLRRALGDGRIRAGGLPEGTGGGTVGLGPNPGDKVIFIQPGLLTPPGGTTGPGFILLADVVFHEGVHLGQDIPLFPVWWAVFRLETLLEWKKEKLEREKEAYEKGHTFKDNIGDELKKMWENRKAGKDVMDGVAPWAEIWKDCDEDTLLGLYDYAYKLAGKYLDKFIATKSALVSIKFKREEMGFSVAMVLIQLNTHDTYRHFFWGLRLFVVDSGSSQIKHAGPGGAALETGIAHPQDVSVITGHDGRKWLLVCGVDREDMPRGIVRAFPEMKRKFPIPPQPPVAGRESPLAEWDANFPGFDPSQGKTIIADDPRLGRATSLMVTPDGRMYVWDVGAAALYVLRDWDGDRIPDGVDFAHGSVVKVPRGLRMEHFADVRWVGEQPIAYMRVLDTVVEGPLRIFRDINRDGYFESILPRDPARLPLRDKKK